MIDSTRADGFIVAVVCAGAVYCLLELSPSSYSIVLRNLGAQETGLLVGKARSLRSDEYAIWTPQVQIAVNNGLERYNATSPYGEDLRTSYSLPLMDWGLAFKPQFWLFALAPPAHAYSFYHVAHAVAFLVGYYLLLQRFGFRKSWAALSATGLFFSSFVQLWWTSLGQHPALLPWVLLCFLSSWPAAVKGLAISYLMAVWLMSAQFYPPYVLSLGIAGFLGVLAFRPEAISKRSLALVAAATVIAGLITALYLQDALPRMMASLNHGQRQMSGGTVPFVSWLGQFLPFFAYFGFESMSPHNPCEAATLGSYAPLLCASLVNFSATRQHFERHPDEARAYRRALLSLVPAFLVITGWMMLKLPYWTGAPLLWHLFPGQRLFFASGLLLWLLVLATLRYCRFDWQRLRLLLFAVLVAVGWGVSKFWLAEEFSSRSLRDLVVLIPLAALATWPNRLQLGTRVIAVAAVANAVGFAYYNPLQSAHPIFERPDTEIIRQLRAQAAGHPRGWIARADGQQYGSVLNGWGLASIGHTLILPEVDFFREFFPELDEAELREVFNRYATVSLSHALPGHRPRHAGSAIVVPERAFSAERLGPLPEQPAAAESLQP